MPLIFLIYPAILLYRFAMEKPDGQKTGMVGSFFYLGCYPVLSVLFNIEGQAEDCYQPEESLMYAQEHLLTFAVFFLSVTMAYFAARLRKACYPPMVEILLNGLLLFGIGLHVVVGMQYWGGSGSIFFLFHVYTAPGAVALLLIQLVRNHQLLMKERLSQKPELVGDLPQSEYQTTLGRYREHGLYDFLMLPFLIKSPLLLVLFAPYLVGVHLVLLIFGQQPDSLVQVFTQTHNHGFSELVNTCNVPAYDGGHYLCSVAAGGHPWVVRPLRRGVRHGHPIVCNRQLLVANAFEELIQERWPAAHRFIRRHYDRVGDFIHKDYTPYENPWLCDAVYLLMKPADWCFRAVLFCCTRDAEARIGRQYGGEQA